MEESRVGGGGEGLFAARDIEAGKVVAYYNGVRIPVQEIDYFFYI